MFTNANRQISRTGKHGTPRQDHLQTLVTQFQDPSQTLTTKLQILSNLANFAYDPYNYPFLRSLNVLELFIDCLSEPDNRFIEFAAGGICNSAVDPENARVIVECGGVKGLVECLGSGEGKTVAYAVTALFYLCESSCGGEGLGLGKGVFETVSRLAEGCEGFEGVRNVARVFLDKHLRKYC